MVIGPKDEEWVTPSGKVIDRYWHSGRIYNLENLSEEQRNYLLEDDTYDKLYYQAEEDNEPNS